MRVARSDVTVARTGFECNDLIFVDGYRSVNPLGTNFITHCKAAFGNVWTLAAREVSSHTFPDVLTAAARVALQHVHGRVGLRGRQPPHAGSGAGQRRRPRQPQRRGQRAAHHVPQPPRRAACAR